MIVFLALSACEETELPPPFDGGVGSDASGAPLDAGDAGPLVPPPGTIDEGECGDGVCSAFESCSTCPADCGPCTDRCGDGFCGALETCESCPIDCGRCPPVCGDGICERGEDCRSCPIDCGDCVPRCGDGVCDPGESCALCPADCGPCPSPPGLPPLPG